MPARTMVFIPVPRRSSTSAAAVSDTGIVIRLIRAVRQERKKAPNRATISSSAISAATPSVPTSSSIKEACR